MGIVDRLRTVIEFATLFWTLKIALYLPTPCPSARHHSTALQTACLMFIRVYGQSWFNSQLKTCYLSTAEINNHRCEKQIFFLTLSMQLMFVN